MTIACQAPLSMRFSRQEYWSELSYPPPGDLPDLGRILIESASLLYRQVGTLPLTPPGNPAPSCTCAHSFQLCHVNMDAQSVLLARTHCVCHPILSHQLKDTVLEALLCLPQCQFCFLSLLVAWFVDLYCIVPPAHKHDATSLILENKNQKHFLTNIPLHLQLPKILKSVMYAWSL